MPSAHEVYAQILEQGWKEGKLASVLLAHQMPLYRVFHTRRARKTVFHCSRRLGKSWTLLTLASETCLRKRRAIVRYGAATQKDVHEIIHPLMRQISDLAPEYLRPIWNQAKGKYIYPSTEAELIVSGLDEGRADNLRGASMDLGIIDEAGFIDDLDYVIRSVLMPQTLTTDGRILLSSTSPRTAGHPFVDFLEQAKQDGSYIKQTIFDDSRPDVLARIPEFMKEAGGADSTTWKREYLCDILTDETSALVPEFQKQEAVIVKPWTRPPFFHRYVAMDLGLIDFTAVLFGYVDFENAKHVIEDEILMNRKDSSEIAEAIKKKEKALWGIVPPFLRIADGNALTIFDFNSIHKLAFGQARNDELEAAINNVRLEVLSGGIVIDPRCQNLIKHLKYGVWDKTHRRFDREPNIFGHYDLVAALMYFCRHAMKSVNPYPLGYGTSVGTHFILPDQKKTQEEKLLIEAFNLNFMKDDH